MRIFPVNEFLVEAQRFAKLLAISSRATTSASVNSGGSRSLARRRQTIITCMDPAEVVLAADGVSNSWACVLMASNIRRIVISPKAHGSIYSLNNQSKPAEASA